jgi:polyvinyl alcohol dehydrogenase (cytochrome)
VRLIDRSVVIAVSAVAVFVSIAFLGAQAPPAPQATTPAPGAPPAGRGGSPGTESGWATFQSQCFRCHTNQAGKAPTAWSIRQLTPEEIVAALNRPSHTEGAALSDIQKRRVGEFMGGRPLGSRNAGEAKSMANQCTANPPLRDPSSGPAWNGWGNDLSNSRFQPAAAARLSATDVSRLKLKWAFGLPKGETNNAQPTVVSGRVFMAGDNGYIYSVDAKSGCVYWSFQNGSIVRGSPMIGAVTGQGMSRWAVFFGDGHANVFAVDAQTGRQLWKTRVDEHVVARITGGVKYYDGRVFVPLSGSEEFVSGNANYPCCTARGGVVALNANTGAVIWKAYNVDEAKPWKKNPNGVQLYGPAAGGVWNSPTIDTVRGALYVGTGDAVTPPESPLTDAVMALDLKTGKVLWSRRATRTICSWAAAPAPNAARRARRSWGPITTSAIRRSSPRCRAASVRCSSAPRERMSSHSIPMRMAPSCSVSIRLVNLSASPDAGAAESCGEARPISDRCITGWLPRALALCSRAMARRHGYSPLPALAAAALQALGAAPTAIPGVVFQGAGDGRLFAVSSSDGKKLWEFDTSQEFKTINNVPAHGGAIATAGAVIVDGMVYIGSGYAISSGASGGNVLLAFGVE